MPKVPPYSGEVFTGFNPVPRVKIPLADLRRTALSDYMRLNNSRKRDNIFKPADASLPPSSPDVKQVFHQYAFVFDLTHSMQKYVDDAKKNIKNIIDRCKQAAAQAVRERGESQALRQELVFQVAQVSYRDFDYEQQFVSHDFTSDIDKFKNWLDGLRCLRGYYYPEDVLGGFIHAIFGLNEAYPSLAWQRPPRVARRTIIWIGDAPPHGNHVMNDDGNKGNNEYHKAAWEAVFEYMHKLGIELIIVKIKKDTEKAIQVLKRLGDQYHVPVEVADCPALAAKAREGDGSSFIASSQGVFSAMGDLLVQNVRRG